MAIGLAGTVFASPSVDLPRIDSLGIPSPVSGPDLHQKLTSADLTGLDRAITANESPSKTLPSGSEALPAEVEQFAKELLGQHNDNRTAPRNKETQQTEQPAATGRLPGMTNRALTRFRREMFRTDI